MMVHDGPRLFSMFQYGSRCFETVSGDQKRVGKVRTIVVVLDAFRWSNVDLDGLKVAGWSKTVHGP